MKIEQFLKRFLKRKISFTQSLLIAFLITGAIAQGTEIGVTLDKVKEYMANFSIDNNFKFELSETEPLDSHVKLNVEGKDLYYILKDSNGVIQEYTDFNSRKDELLADENVVGNFYLSSIISEKSGTYSYSRGGAVYNNSGKIGDITGNFIGNYAKSLSDSSMASAYGGAIHNESGEIGNIKGNFIGNYVSGKGPSASSGSNGGAIHNNNQSVGDRSNIGNIEGDFIGNYAISLKENTSGGYASGGAIYNNNSSSTSKNEILNITGDFIGNYTSAIELSRGGAIFNSGSSTMGEIGGDFIGNYATSSEGKASGGAIYNNAYHTSFITTIGNITGDFIDNYVNSAEDAAGGAIYNSGRNDSTNNSKILNITGNFKGNHAISSVESAAGGAIHNFSATIGDITGDFEGNYVSSADISQGGAIYNSSNSVMGDITGNFIGNYVSGVNGAEGGAIYNSEELTLKATGAKPILFEGNKAIITDASGKEISSTSNAIHNDYDATINFLAEDGSSITFNDGITGDLFSNISIGGTKDGVNYNGDIVINADMSKYLGTVNFNKGTIKIGEDNKVDGEEFNNFFGGKFSLNGDNLVLNSINNKMDNFNTEKWQGRSLLDVGIDIDFGAEIADKFSNITPGTKINISSIEILNPEEFYSKEIRVEVGTGETGGLTTSLSTVTGTTPIFEYTYNIDSSELASHGDLILRNPNIEPPLEPELPEEPNVPGEPGDGNSSVTPGNPGDGASGFNPEVLKSVAAIGGYTTNLENLTDRVLNKDREYDFGNSIWLDTYYSDQKLSYSSYFGKEKYDNEVNMTTVGIDYLISNLNGRKQINRLYLGHIKSTQRYDEIETSQESFHLGTGVEIEKGDHFVNFTLVGGRGKVEDKKESSENFDVYSLSVATKLGTSYQINENITIKPSLIVGYHNISADDYTNKDNVKIESETINILNVTPEIKVVGDLNGYKPYAVLGYNHNYYSGEGSAVLENGTTSIEVSLPTAEIESYIEMRAGITKEFKETIKVYGEIIKTEGDKDSIGGQIGIEYKF